MLINKEKKPLCAGNISSCRICRCRFYSIPYTTCPYTVKWICGCKREAILDNEMVDNRIFLTEEQLGKGVKYEQIS